MPFFWLKNSGLFFPQKMKTLAGTTLEIEVLLDLAVANLSVLPDPLFFTCWRSLVGVATLSPFSQPDIFHHLIKPL